MDYQPDGKLAEGKTKVIWRVRNEPGLVIVESKDDITAGDGAKHDELEGKAALSTETTCNVFELLRTHGVPVAFQSRLNETSFLATQCEMLKYEVVVRRQAYGSYLKRNPNITKGERFPELVLEFFLKTSNKQWQGRAIPVDDPLIVMRDGNSYLYRPDAPVDTQTPFLYLDGYPQRHEEMGRIALTTFAHLETAWVKLERNLVDFKVEFGLDSSNRLLLADVIDNDSWRLLDEKHAHLDKQVYRDGGALDDVLSRFRQVAELTKRFNEIQLMLDEPLIIK